MNLFPLWNSLRIASIATVLTFLIGIFLAYRIAKLPRLWKGLLDVILTLPMVLPPTVVGFFLLKVIGTNGPVGAFFYRYFSTKLTMKWYSSIFATTIVSFPLMYRAARSAFESFDEELADAGKTLGLGNCGVFWLVRIPCSRQGILAGVVLAFARAIGEYGATSMVSGYIPTRTATISTTVYQLWREGNDALAYRWVLINLAISFLALIVINFLEDDGKSTGKVPAEARKQ